MYLLRRASSTPKIARMICAACRGMVPSAMAFASAEERALRFFFVFFMAPTLGVLGAGKSTID